MKKFLPYVGLGLLVVLILGIGLGFLYYAKDKPEIPSRADNGSPTITDQITNGKVNLKNLGPAPDFTGIDTWLNSGPQTLSQLQGKVVLVEFWTYSCKTCIDAIAQLNKWQQTYEDQGFAVVSIHTPEYMFEKLTDNVQTASTRFGITYPVGLDNNYKTWTAYGNQFWPSIYLIDKNGTLAYTHFGDLSQPAQIENAIEQLLTLPGGVDANYQPQQKVLYVGLNHLSGLSNVEVPTNTEQVYAFSPQIKKNSLAVEGTWKFDAEASTLTQGFGRIKLRLTARNIKLLAQSIKPVTLKISIDKQPVVNVPIQDLQAYTLLNSNNAVDHLITIEVPQPGFVLQRVIYN